MSSAPSLGHHLSIPLTPNVTPIVFVVDDDATVRESLELLICREGWQSETFKSAREFVVPTLPLIPCCLILDLDLPNLNALEVQRSIARECPEIPIIFISGCHDIGATIQAMKAGAVDFLVKPFNDGTLLRAIRDSLERCREALDRKTRIRDLRNRYASLTPRERQVMTLVVAGLLNKQVGAELDISEITVKAHRGRVMEKMKASSLAHLVKMDVVLNVTAEAAPLIETNLLAIRSVDCFAPVLLA
jgi:FixJ family two-component response regulator